MSFLELALKRSSVRAYTTDPVPEDLLQKVLEAGRIAPSAANFQPWHFIVVRDPAIQRALGDAYAKTWFWQAPVIIVVCVEPARAWTRFDGKIMSPPPGRGRWQRSETRTHLPPGGS